MICHKDKIQIYIGYDSREILPFHVLFFSILERSSLPISIIPLKIDHLYPIIEKDDPKSSTQFSLTRFLVPYLSGYEGISIFMDCDMLCLCDIHEVIKMSSNKTVYVCPHDYQSKVTEKFTGKNENYPKKNWSSFMVYNNEKCKHLTPEYIKNSDIKDLHRLEWANNDIGYLPLEYNWLVGEYEKKEEIKILHFTLGTPCFDKYKKSDYSELWWREYQKMISA